MGKIILLLEHLKFCNHANIGIQFTNLQKLDRLLTRVFSGGVQPKKIVQLASQCHHPTSYIMSTDSKTVLS